MDVNQALCLGFLIGFIVATIISLIARRENLSDLEVYRQYFGEIHDIAGLSVKAPRTEAWGRTTHIVSSELDPKDLPPLPDFLK
jgi:purine-cytosine permease-like protein